jgi:predicted dienelactone hydrolase
LVTVGFAEGLSFDESRTNWDGDGPRPLSWAVWYPSEEDAKKTPLALQTAFLMSPVAKDAPLQAADRPSQLVLLSHGSGGIAAGLEWLAYRLAQKGFVALAVNHHGHTGVEAYRAEGFLCLWERANDLKALLDDCTWRRQLGGKIADRAYLVGFSAGAYTAMLLIGARVVYSQFEPENHVTSPVRGPREFPDLADHIPRLLRDNPVFKRAWDRRRDDYSDARFDAALALAPGRSVLGFSAESLRSITRPVQIIAGDADTIAPAEQCSKWLHELVAASKFTILQGGIGHYAFLSEPTLAAKKQAPGVFGIPKTIERQMIHDEVADLTVGFFASVRGRASTDRTRSTDSPIQDN